MFGFTLECVDLSTFSCNLVHMTASTSLTSPTAESGTVLQGVPVVPGVQYAPVICPGKLPEVDRESTTDLAAEQRPAEGERFNAAATAVATRLRERAAHA
ncbi:MAG: phosphoenolpyruvate-utilizing N-terminal domain-containing protein, partial [Mycobacterium sp.]